MSTYNQLLDGGWKMNEIDDMDMLGFLQVKAWKAQKDYDEKHTPKRMMIDQAWAGLRSK